ncbi:GTP cyclohydrolase I FolE [Gayadomonas joobiniege]|uniref:GTP cyclohydrolase I FolE n=1 Tax=Gayadomonas joobiniege TaxID=1234606 RepID=UPI000363577C|nr:GTP cyclohydrolase I FolE [Gayadomonas joobiniege]
MLSPEAQKVKQALLAEKLETPMLDNSLAATEKKDKIAKAMQDIMQVLGLNLSDDSLAETPARIAKMYVDEIFSGLDYHNFPKITCIQNSMAMDEMITVDKISFTSTCEHHFVTIDGLAKIAYIPADKVIGLSKINRIMRFFARRPQVQERLTQQVLIALQTLLETQDVAVSIKATHYCVKARGVMDLSSETKTTALGGVFKSSLNTRQEFLAT